VSRRVLLAARLRFCLHCKSRTSRAHPLRLVSFHFPASLPAWWASRLPFQPSRNERDPRNI